MPNEVVEPREAVVEPDFKMRKLSECEGLQFNDPYFEIPRLNVEEAWDLMQKEGFKEWQDKQGVKTLEMLEKFGIETILSKEVSCE